jgi:hypothetical protein
VVGVGHVTGDRQHLAAELPDAVRRRLVAGLIAVKQNEVGAGLGQRRRHGAAHALRASGNNGYPAGQIKQVRHGSRGLVATAGVRPEGSLRRLCKFAGEGLAG